MSKRAYPVFLIAPMPDYYGNSMVAAADLDEANEIIDKFKESDPNNTRDSYGYSDMLTPMENLYSEKKGIIHYGIFYCG